MIIITYNKPPIQLSLHYYDYGGMKRKQVPRAAYPCPFYLLSISRYILTVKICLLFRTNFVALRLGSYIADFLYKQTSQTMAAVARVIVNLLKT